MYRTEKIATKIYIHLLKCFLWRSFMSQQLLTNTWLHSSWADISQATQPCKKETTGSSYFLTCPAMSVCSIVSGTLLGWADMSAESSSGLIVTLGLPVTPVNTARTTMSLTLIVICRKTHRCRRKGKRPPLWRSAGEEMSLLSMWSYITQKGGRGSRDKRLSRSCCLPVYYFCPPN